MIYIKMNEFKYEELINKKQEELNLNDATDYTLDQVRRYDFGKRKTFDGDQRKQFYGLLTQNIIADFISFYQHQDRCDGNEGFDSGKDLFINNTIVDVKTMLRTGDVKSYFTNNLIKSQTKYKTEYYLFCSYNTKKNEVTICGLYNKDLLVYEKVLKTGETVNNPLKQITFETDVYNIDNKYLIDVNSFDDIMYHITDNEIIKSRYNNNKFKRTS